ncbi:MAG TPA: FAD-binding oxidoreductase [Aestuariivirga sp.]|nr:FAD-binding oxidoreductase [Aestuariivirga sp.]
MATDFDVIVIGAGIAGASVAAHLAETGSVLVLDMEERPGFHSTGRSASSYEPNYGPPSIRALTRAGRSYFSEGGFLTPRQTLFLMPEGQEESFAKLMKAQHGMREIGLSAAQSLFPLLRENYARRFLLDPGTADVDVDLLHQTYLRLIKSRGGVVVCAAPVEGLERVSRLWKVATSKGLFRARTIINAAGAWGDHIAKLAGAKPAGLQPKRRSMAVVPMPEGVDPMTWPLAGDVGETWYCRPQSGKLLISPADAAPVEAHDAFADEMTLAEGIDRFQQAIDFEVTRVEHTWGGLRSFVSDGNPVVGFDPEVEGFFWLIGQGGYGIQTSPALSRLAAALVRGEAAPGDILDEGLVLKELWPERFAIPATVASIGPFDQPEKRA